MTLIRRDFISYDLWLDYNNEAIDELGLSSKALIHHVMSCAEKGGKWERIRKYLFRAPVTLSDIMTLLQPLEHSGHGSLLFSELLHLQGLTTTTGLFLQVLKRLLNKLNILDP